MPDLYDLDAERQVLGGMLTDPESCATAARLLRADDFGRPAHAVIFDAAVDAHGKGRLADPRAVAAVLAERKMLDEFGGPASFVSLAAAAVLRSTIGRQARTIIDLATRRRLHAAAGELERLAGDFRLDAAEAVDEARSIIGSVSMPVAESPSDLWDLDVFLDKPEGDRPDWVVPGLLRQRWRVLVVAPEGTGKSMLFRQFAICAAQGLHPFTFEQVRSVRTLIVDLENPEDILRDKASPIRDQARRMARPYRDGQAWLWHRPAGINLRTRADAAEFEACLRDVRPELVCMGPLYKAYRVGAKENDELATGEVQHRLDDLRSRFGFALLLEHHAPKKQAGVRDLVPYGSSLWLRWPETGLKLVPLEQPRDSLSVERWRGDRSEAAWPSRLDRSRPWPWAGFYADGWEATA